jgi:hypothetical protein
MIELIRPAAAASALKAISTIEGAGGQGHNAPSALADARPPSGSGQDLATTVRAFAGQSADLEWTHEVQQAMLAFQSGDTTVAAQQLAPLAQQGSAIAEYDLHLIFEFGFGALGNREPMRALYSKSPTFQIGKLGGGLVA